MKEMVKDMFAEIHMPDSCEEKIRQAMKQTKPQPMCRRPVAVAAVALSVLLFAGMSMNTQVRAAVEEFVKRYVFFGGSTVVEVQSNGTASVSARADLEEIVQNRQGRLYLIANGEDRDITDEISPDQPYIYTFVDHQNVQNILILGGSVENLGYHKFYREDGGNGNWLAGDGYNYLDEQTGKAAQWVVQAWQMLNLPWPVPGV